jgi:hypothetical protein
VPLAGEARRQLQQLGDLRPGVALVQQAQGLVVQVGVEVALLPEEVDDPLAAPAGPVVAGEQHLAAVAEQLYRLVEVVRPEARVADQGAARGEDVVHRAGGVVGDAERFAVGQEEVHLGRRLGPRRQLELEANAVDHRAFAGRRDLAVRRQQRDRAERDRLPEPGAELAVGGPLEQRPVHVAGAAGHRGAGETFSLTAWWRKPTGARIGTSRSRASSGVSAPRAPPKWSTWLCV